MSASDKKRLRKEQENALLTEKQQKQRKEEKKTRFATIGFLVLMAVVVVAAAAIMINQAINRSGVFEKNTVAVTVGDHQLNTVEFAYYFIDTINDTYTQWNESMGDYTSMYLSMGLDVKQPLDKQVYSEETGETWADYFIGKAKEQALSDYALYDDAVKAGFELSQESAEEIDNLISNYDMYAQWFGLKNADEYFRSMYGNGSTAASFKQYSTVRAIAQEYYTAHKDGLTYDDAAIRAYDSANPEKYNGYNFASYYISYNSFLEGGTEGEDGNITYSDAEKDAARAAAKAAAETLLQAGTVAELDELIGAMSMNEGKEVASTKNEDKLYTSLDNNLKDWLSDPARQENDIEMIPNTVSSDSEDEKAPVNGYTVVMFQSSTDNVTRMGDVRHILISLHDENEDTDSDHEHTEQEYADAKAKAESLLASWKAGDATEKSFIDLVKDNTGDTASAETGGLYENIYPGANYTENFREWALDESRKPGDTGIVESEYGYHIMYYVGDSKQNYRDYLITNEMRNADLEEWYNALKEPYATVVGDLSRMKLDIVLNSGS